MVSVVEGMGIAVARSTYCLQNTDEMHWPPDGARCQIHAVRSKSQAGNCCSLHQDGVIWVVASKQRAVRSRSRARARIAMARTLNELPLALDSGNWAEPLHCCNQEWGTVPHQIKENRRLCVCSRLQAALTETGGQASQVKHLQGASTR